MRWDLNLKKTDSGEFVMQNHNEHNGYYGGFYIVAREIKA